MNNLRARPSACALIVTLCATGCASVPGTPPIVRPPGLAVTDLADLTLPPGTTCIVWLTGGGTVRGKLLALSNDRLEIRDESATDWHIAYDDVVVVARVTKMSKGARGCLGAAIGALASLPFAISMFGDLMVPASIAGALIGRNTGDSRAEVVFERPAVPPAGTRLLPAVW